MDENVKNNQVSDEQLEKVSGGFGTDSDELEDGILEALLRESAMYEEACLYELDTIPEEDRDDLNELDL